MGLNRTKDQFAPIQNQLLTSRANWESWFGVLLLGRLIPYIGTG